MNILDYSTMYETNPMYESVGTIQEIVKKLNPQKILEMGTERGCSYYHIAKVHKGYLLGVDCWQPIEGYPFSPNNFIVFKEIFKTLKGDFHYKQGLFQDVVPALGKFDIILYDGGHIKGQTQKDWDLLLPHLEDNGIVLIHDVVTPKCDELEWWWENSIKYPSYTLGGRFGLGIIAPKGDENIKKLIGIIPHIRYNDILRCTEYTG